MCAMSHVPRVMSHESCPMRESEDLRLPCAMCHVSRVMCHESCPVCHASCAMRSHGPRFISVFQGPTLVFWEQVELDRLVKLTSLPLRGERRGVLYMAEREEGLYIGAMYMVLYMVPLPSHTKRGYIYLYTCQVDESPSPRRGKRGYIYGGEGRGAIYRGYIYGPPSLTHQEGLPEGLYIPIYLSS